MWFDPIRLPFNDSHPYSSCSQAEGANKVMQQVAEATIQQQEETTVGKLEARAARKVLHSVKLRSTEPW